MAKLAINGGEKACYYEWTRWPIWDDKEQKNLNDVLESGDWWYGARVREFEEKFAAFQDAKFGVTTTSGTTALEVSLLALGIGAGDEVIVPPYTFMATASAVLRVNAVPVFADIDGNSLCIDPDDLERKITPRAKAIIPVHLAGYVSDMDRLREIADKYNLKILEDACHSWGSQWNSKGTGAIGHCGVFSFQHSKNIAAGEGGIILTDDETLADSCRSFSNCGRIKGEAWYKHFILGSNFRMTEFQAAILLAQLTRLEEQTLKRQANAEILNERLKDVPGISVVKNDPRMTRRSYHFYPVRLDLEKLGVTRNRFTEALSAEGVAAVPGYTTPLYTNPLFTERKDGRRNYTQEHCPVCERVCDDTCWIWQTVLLADENTMRDVAGAVIKVVENIEEIRQ